MDTDLDSASASFIGDNVNDWYGHSVACAGDVNGDGYDDILIGAPNNGDGGSYAGHTYLILGKESGWSLNTKPSKVDASFKGEDARDVSGYSVAGAGDVNGDGYDDILIGAWGNDDGGSEAGKTYLIFGKASGWSQNTLLSKANASFIGEEADDQAGYSVAGAGDVNGDGYDDILIGAHRNDEGFGRQGGQTYLVFGKASGWSMDTDLSNVSASFYGENPMDYSGFSVAGPGDVNGDGYDDILIGAFANDEGGAWAGQTYLILGNVSGWRMDINLSKSDASFIGEDAGDYSGYSVAGAGDVNSDGYDDFLIGAYRDEEGGTNAGQTYLILGMASGWSMDTSLSNANASFLGEDQQDQSGYSVSDAADVNGDGFDDFLIGAYGDEEGGANAGQTYLILGKANGWSMDTDLSKADVSFLGEGIGDEAGKSVAGAGDVNGDGYDDILIGAPRDDAGGTDCGRVYLIFYDDGEIPVLRSDSTSSIATTGDPFTFNVSVADNIGISNVSIEFWYGDIGYHWNLSSDLSSGDQTDGTWLLNITVPLNSIGPMHYIVHVWDRAFNPIKSTMRNVVVLDNDPPMIANDTTQSNGTTGDDFQFKTNATDNINLTDLRVEYWYGDNGTHMNVSMDRLIVDVWGLNISIPPDSLDELHYHFYAEDNSSNNVSSETRDVTVLDNDLPTIFEDTTPTSIETEASLAFTIHVDDNIGVEQAWVVYRYGDGQGTNQSLFDTTGAAWEGTVTVLAIPEDLHYFFGASDTSGNVNLTGERTVDVIDMESPEIVIDATGPNATTGDPFIFNITVKDNVGLGNVAVWYTFGDSDPSTTGLERVTSSHSGGVVYSVSIHIPSDFIGSMTYHFEVQDLYGNINTSITKIVMVMDDDNPVIVEDITPNVGYLGDRFTFGVTVSDNCGIDRVEMSYSFGNSEPTNEEMARGDGELDPFSLAIDIPINADGPIAYQFTVTDLSGNALASEQREVTLKDGIPPEILKISWSDPIKGLDLSIMLEATDNVGVDRANLTYWYTGGPTITVKMDENLVSTIPIPRGFKGLLRFIIEISDKAGNQVTSIKMELMPVNSAPEIGTVPTWYVEEGKESTLDVEPYISDTNDATSSLTIVCNDPNVTVEGLKLRAIFDMAVAGLVLKLTISDGEDGVQVEVPVVIENVNDAPIILSVSPINGSKFKEGRKITFTVDVVDEDGDDLTVTWISGQTTIGTGTTLDYKKLQPGNRIVRVVVYDGIDTVENEITLVIDKNGESPLFILIATIAAIIIIIGFATRRIRK